MATSPDALQDDAAPIVDFDVIKEGVDAFYECNNNNAKNIVMCESKRGLVSELTSGGGGMRSHTCRLDNNSLTDLFLKKYHAHNELIENNLYCINTKKIEETIDLIDLGDTDVFQPVVIDTCQEVQVFKSEDSDNHKEQLSISSGNAPDHKNKSILQDGQLVHGTSNKEPSLLDLTEDGFNEVVNSLLGDTVCTNHVLADVREDFERLKVNVDELNEQFRFNCNDDLVTPDGLDDYERNESYSNQVINSIINQSDTNSHIAVGRIATKSKSIDEDDLSATDPLIDVCNEHGNLFCLLSFSVYSPSFPFSLIRMSVIYLSLPS